MEVLLCFSSTRSYSPKEASHRKEHLQDRFVSSRNMTTMRKFWTIALLLHRLYEKCYAIIRRVSFS